MASVAEKSEVASDVRERIKQLRARLGLTQVQLAELMGVSFASVNRWENGQARPSDLAWQRIVRAEELGLAGLGKGAIEPAEPTVREPSSDDEPAGPPDLDFSTDPEIVRVVAEGERLAYGHLFNQAFATETSLIDPLPHQRIAVYQHMLPESRLRLLLGDDTGAGKTIMAGLYAREMLARRLIRRVLVVAPAGLVGNWERELRTLFNLAFSIVSGADARAGNPFVGPESDLVIVSVDTLSAERAFSRLRESAVVPYDLVIFDEAHKLAADRQPDFTMRRTDRYRLAEALAGIRSDDPRWALDWSCRHLLLLTATPHMGKDFPYYCLWRLLEPEVLSTFDAFQAYPVDARRRHFVRRTKEEMVRFDGTPIYPTRVSDTFSYELAQGETSEQTLYDETTDYIRYYYNRARILNRSAARLAMSVFQRRLASSTYALLRSFERRLARLDELIEGVRTGRIKLYELDAGQRKLDEARDVLDEMTADEEGAEGGREQNEVAEERLLGATVGRTLAQLEDERLRVQRLLGLARQVHAAGEESKFTKLRDLLRDPQFRDEKLIIFTEHRDTLDFLVRRLEALGFAGRVAQIHGGMDYREREAQIEFFRGPATRDGATYLVATDAAGEGINLQFCWLMINYDIPWNPARLEQRMGRIHRYGQRHDPVYIANLVAGKTREGRVLKTLLDKLDRIRRELSSDKVFDVIGRLFEGVSLREYLEQAVTESGADGVVRRIEGTLTREQVQAIRERERRLLGDGGDVRAHLPDLKAQLQQEELRRLLPGYVRRFVEKAAPLMNLGVEGDLDGTFSLKALAPGALDPFWPVLEAYPAGRRQRLTVYRPGNGDEAIFLHPGEPFFERFRSLVGARFARAALQGGVFVDPTAQRPYLFHLALIAASRKADPAFRALAHDEVLEYRLVGLRQDEAGQIEACPVECLLLLRGEPNPPSPFPAREGGGSIGTGARVVAGEGAGERSGSGAGAIALQAPLAATANEAREVARAYALERVARPLAEGHRRRLVESLGEREDFLARGYDYEEADLATRRSKLGEKVRAGDPRAKGQLARIKEQQRALSARREEALAALRREPELIAPDEVAFLAHALVVPSSDPEDRKRHDAEVEAIAVRVVRAHEEAAGATVRDVSTAKLALAANLAEHPGFDLLSRRPGGEERAIEVKGRAAIGDVELTENEWAKACNLRERYWLYVVYDCASPHPRLLRVQDPFARLLIRAKGGVVVHEEEIFSAAEV